MKRRGYFQQNRSGGMWLGVLVMGLLAGGIIWGASPSRSGPTQKQKGDKVRPNVLLILADDLGWRDLSIQGSIFYETPNIDRIGREGMRFTQGYATCCVCSPSRASILTGKFTARHGITEWIGQAEGTQWRRNTRMLPAHYRHNLSHSEFTLAEALRRAGYRTFFAGKWHLGGPGSYPEDHGFEFNVGGYEAGSPRGGYFSPYKNPKLKDGPVGESLPIRLATETVKFIRAHRNEPFFAYLCFYSVHAPLQTTEALWRKYRDKAERLPRPDWRFVVDRTLPVRQVQDHPVYAGMIETMDRAVGMVLKALDDLGLSDRTIVIFTSDNGGVSSGDAYSTSNLPLRGGKGRQWEGGVREPFFIKWPGVTRPGSTCDVPVTGADFYPTILQMCGLPLIPSQHVDGVSLVPLLRGTGTIPHRPLFWHYPHYSNQGGDPCGYVRDGDWKLIHYYEDGHNELYNLRQDPGELHDVANKYPEVVKRLWGELKAYLDETHALFPTPNPNFDPQRYAQHQRWIRTVLLPRLERQHAAVLERNWTPSGGWWQYRGD